MKTVILTAILLTPTAILLGEDKAKEPTEVKGHPFSWPFVSWEKMKPYGGTTKASRTELNLATKASFNAIYEEGLARKEQDRRAILALAGDHRVSFDFIETASTSEGYEPPRPYFSWATERTFVVADESDFISLQHVMVMEYVDEKGEIQGPFTMKHWRQDWSYRDQFLVEYRGDKTWVKRKIRPPRGQWTQAVYQVDDSPRYETIGRWSHQGGMSIFRSRNFWRPLPRREFSVRNDYNVLAGIHEITITPTGWLHSQYNQKVVVTDGEVTKTLATELGAVRYERITTPSLELAESYWEKTGDFWQAIRSTWKAIESGDDPFTLEGKIEGKSMYQYLFEIAGRLENSETELAVAQIEGMAVIGRFLKNEKE